MHSDKRSDDSEMQTHPFDDLGRGGRRGVVLRLWLLELLAVRKVAAIVDEYSKLGEESMGDLICLLSRQRVESQIHSESESMTRQTKTLKRQRN